MTAIVFDLDGTLLDTLADLTAATNHILRRYGFPERTVQEIRRIVGNGARRQLEQSFPAGVDVTQAVEEYKRYYTAHCEERTHPYPGIVEALEALRREYPLAIVSNKPDTAVRTLCARYFPGIFALGERPGIPRKPAGDMLHAAIAAIGADRCVYVGDSEVDLLTARNAGVPCVSVLWGFRDREELQAAGATCLCQAPGELTKVLQQLFQQGI